MPGRLIPVLVCALALANAASGCGSSVSASSAEEPASSDAAQSGADASSAERAQASEGEGAAQSDTVSSSAESSQTSDSEGSIPNHSVWSGVYTYTLPESSGTDITVSSDGTAACDLSCVSDGIVRVSYTGNAERIRITLTEPDGTECPYPVTYTENGDDDYTAPTYNAEMDLSTIVLALTGGDGSYRVDVQEYIDATGDYAYIFSKRFDTSLSDSFEAALLPNYYVNFTEGDAAASRAADLADSCGTDLLAAEAIYKDVTASVSYNDDEAAWMSSSHIPYPQAVLENGSGVALDYASLTAAMLRSVGIPARLVSGYSSDRFHSWVSVYLTSSGTIADTYTCAGNEWVLLDPAIGASNSASDVRDYIADRSHYTAMYVY